MSTFRRISRIFRFFVRFLDQKKKEKEKIKTKKKVSKEKRSSKKWQKFTFNVIIIIKDKLFSDLI